MAAEISAQVVVIGGGPGGYTAAFRAADLGKQVVLVERYPTLGGVCLNVGCIPSKALLHMARVITEAKEARQGGIRFGELAIDLPQLREWKAAIVGRLTKGLAGLAARRRVTTMQGSARFTGPDTIEVAAASGTSGTPSVTALRFEQCVIATGSSPVRLAGIPYDDPRVMDSTGALALQQIPQRLLVIGGGIIGLEMACVYDALGARVTVVELLDQLVPGADADLVAVLHQRLKQRYAAIHLGTRVAGIERTAAGLRTTFEGAGAPAHETFDGVLVAVGRRPNGRDLNAEAAGVRVLEHGFIPVDARMRTNVPAIFAIGDVAGEPMLAHKASHEARIAAEVIAGHGASFTAVSIPAVAYTDPEIAWCGLTEAEAKRQGVDYGTGSFPWSASGRALTMGRGDGLTKLVFERHSNQLLGAGIVGVHAGELIAELCLALEMQANVEDLALTIHPHPTLSETPMFAAEVALGSITDLYLPRN
jgi:dihydrolipoamide dehydrogenase